MRRIVQGSEWQFDRTFSYNRKLARWWIERAGDCAHRYAYKNIADFIHASFRRTPHVIVDYACGAGNLLSLLSRRFMNSKLLGLDGSAVLLNLAERRFSRLPNNCARRISLIHTSLPKFNLLRGCADLTIFCFPNMMPFSGEGESGQSSFWLSRNDQRIAKSLSEATEEYEEERNPADRFLVQQALERGRRISRNLRQLLIHGGTCIRVEYATTQRHEWSALDLQRVSFEEGSLDTQVDGVRPRQWFHLLASAYFRSRVMADVYQQTGDMRDKNGGYLITVLRAV